MDPIGLKEVIRDLRKELSDSIKAASDEELRFMVGQITLEFQVEVERSKEGSGGIKFWVVNIGGQVAKASTATHKITIPLSPVTQTGIPVFTGFSGDVPD